MDEIASLFLGDSAIKTTLCELCNARDQLCADPISDTLCAMHNAPISVMITTVGVALFKDQPVMVIPYSVMSKAQLEAILQYVTQFRQNRDGGVKASGDVRMGEGNLILQPTLGQPVKNVPLPLLLNTFIDLVLENKTYDNWAKRSICSIVLQRLSASIGSNGDVLRNANSRVLELFSSQQQVME